MPNNRRPASKAVLRTKKQPRAVASSTDRVIDFERYIPTVVSSLMTKLRNSAQTYFDERYGITRLEWRILSFLASEGPSSAYDIWTIGNLDKAGVSRAVKALEARGFLSVDAVPKSNRRRTSISLTAAGKKLNKDTFQEIVDRHRLLLSGLSNKEIETFISIAKRIEERIPSMDDNPDTATSNFDATKPSPASAPAKK